MNLSVSALLAAAAAGAAALTYSPMPCACESPWQAVYAAAGLSSSEPYRYHDPKEIESGLNRYLKGQVVRGSSSYFFSACKAKSSRLVECLMETEEAGRARRGYIIQMELDKRGRFERAKVRLHESAR